jgi:hypothetical protein
LLSVDVPPPELAASAVLLPEEGLPAGAPPALALALSELLWPAALPSGLAAAPLAALDDEALLPEEEPLDGDAPALALSELLGLAALP